MALKIKEGESIFHHGINSNPFTSESNLSQAILEHLQPLYPEQIIEDKETKTQSPKKDK